MQSKRRVPLHRWLATLPGLLILLGVPFANRVEPRVLGMPFLLAWIVGCVLLTSVVMAVVGRLDDQHAQRERNGR
jgi:quinol-cytochrome oxidoreductase complex cytochrome b subunit